MYMLNFNDVVCRLLHEGLNLRRITDFALYYILSIT